MTEHLRAHLERWKARHQSVDTSDRIAYQGLCDHCFHKWPCADYSDAVAALDILNNAEADMFDEAVGMVALIPNGAAWHLVDGKGWMRIDPVPGATIATRETHT